MLKNFCLDTYDDVKCEEMLGDLPLPQIPCTDEAKEVKLTPARNVS